MAIIDEEEWEESFIAPEAIGTTYPRMSRSFTKGRLLPKTVHRCCGFVAASVTFPADPVVHLYDRVYPHETVQDSQTGRIIAVQNAAPMTRNDAALARQGVARLVRCIPMCSAVGSFHELSTGYADARGAVACPECFPE